jgi:DNA-directed RNA polymerases I, II, and III subunit RPABC2
MESKLILSDDNVDLYKKYDIKNNISEPILTKYEYTKILGMRAQQLAMGAEALIEVTEDLNDVVLIAEEELRQRKTPIIIQRNIGVNKYEYWKIEDLAIYSN